MKKNIFLILLLINFYQQTFSQQKMFFIEVRENDDSIVNFDSIQGVGKHDTIRMYYIDEDGKRTGESAKFVGKFINGKPTGTLIGYDQDSMKVTAQVANGEQNGKTIKQYRDGKKYFIAYYKNDKLNGKYREWDNNGRLTKKYFYKNGKLNGLDMSWYSNGQLEYKRKNKNDKIKDGKYTTWYRNGKKQTYVKLKNYKPINVFYEWNELGKLIRQYNYTDTIFTDYYENGKIYFEYSYKNKRAIYYSKTGQKLRAETFKSDSSFKKYDFYYYNVGPDIKNYVDTIWYPKGQLESVNFYKNGKQNGASVFFYENGEKGYRQYYIDGRLDSICKSWYPSGQIKAIATYSKGNLLEMQSWYENGKIESEENCKIISGNPHFLGVYSVLDGEYKIWDEKGNITTDKIYKEGIVVKDLLAK